MIKLLSLLVLLVFAQSATEVPATEESSLEISWDQIVKCVKSAEPIVHNIPRLLFALEQQDYTEVLNIIKVIYEDLKTSVDVCSEMFKDENLQALPGWVLNLINIYGRSILGKLAQFGIEFLRKQIEKYFRR